MIGPVAHGPATRGHRAGGTAGAAGEPLGSTVALASSAGAISTSYSYTPGGVATATGAPSPNTFEFNATQNEGTGLYLMGARYYDPATGTFISPDPTGFASGTNLYAYANNDPVNHSDPTGCSLARDNCLNRANFWGIAIGALVGAALILAIAAAFPVVTLSFLAGTLLAAAGAVAGGFVGYLVTAYAINHCPD